MPNSASFLMSIALSIAGAFASYAIQEQRYSPKCLAMVRA
jgi:hypothetical protein